MSSTQSHSPAASYPLSFQSTAASLSCLFACRPLFSIACSLFSENTRGGGTLPTYEPSFTHAKSIPSYHIHVNQAVSTNYALFCATGIRHLPCFQHLPHSFVVDRGWYPPVHTVSTPASPSCFEPGLPIHTTLHRTALSGSSSRMSSTACPRLSRKLPCSRNPRSEASTTRQGILIWFRSRLMIRLARFFAAIRFKRRPSGTGNV